MKPSELIEAIERFFLDIIAYLIPGSALIISCFALWQAPGTLARSLDYAQLHSVAIYLFCFSAYVLGQILETFGTLITWPLISATTSGIQRCCPGSWNINIKSKSEIEKAVVTSLSVTQAISIIRSRTMGKFDPESKDLHSWRSRAMGDLSPDQSHIVYRFMFISILNLGMASVCLVLFVSALISDVNLALQHWFAFPMADFARGHEVSLTLLSLVMLYFFANRRSEFYARSMRVPFSMAAAKETQEIGESREDVASVPRAIYLAGGMRSGWQDRVMRSLPEFRFFDPRSHQLHNADAYTAWDLDAVRDSDWVFAYLEESNPGGFSLALELGYAKALSKKLILVDEKSASNEEFRRRLAMLHSIADYCPDSLEEAVSILKQVDNPDKTSSTEPKIA